MVIYCFVPQCKSFGTNGLHAFPADPERRQKWMLATKTTHLGPNENQSICRKHFKESELFIDIDGKNRLVEDAIPSVCLPKSSMLGWDHNYSAVYKKKVQRLKVKRLKRDKQDQELIHSEKIVVGNEIELNADRNVLNKQSQLQPDLGQYLNINYVKFLEEKLIQVKKEKALLATKLRNRNNQVKRLQRKAKSSKLNDKKVLEYFRVKKKYSSAQIQFQRMQLRNAGRKPNGHRYFPKEKSLCLALYKNGPRSYRFQETYVVLPSISTLGRFSAEMMFQAGISQQLFEFINQKVKDWSEEDLCCILSFDEVGLKARLQHNRTTDEIDGFVELAGIRKPVFATHALTFMLRGIKRPFKQPVAFYYTHGLKSYELAELILMVAEKVMDTGLNIIGSVSDQIVVNEVAVHQLMDRHFRPLRSRGALIQFKVRGKIVIHCYDVPHLLKVQRNNMLVKNLVHFISKRWDVSDSKMIGGQKLASWQDVADIYKDDKYAFPRLLPEIKDEHINPTKLKMKVCVATQVFSQTYGTAMQRVVEKKKMSESAEGTAQVLLFFNDLFDSLNGSGPVDSGSLKGSIDEHSIHFAYWEYALFMLSKMKFVNVVTGETMTKSTVLYKWMSTIRGYQEITRICLNMNMKEVSLRNCDSDGLENLFGCVKSCCQIACTPTLTQFRAGYTTMMINNLTGPKSLATNCEPDKSVALLDNIHELILEYHTKTETSDSETNQYELYNDVVCDPQFSTHLTSSFEIESLSSNSNLICAKILEKIICENCLSSLRVELPAGSASHDERSIIPSDFFREECKKTLEFALQIIPMFCSEKQVKKIVIAEVKKLIDQEGIEVELGCVDHSQEITDKLYESTIDYALCIFCKNINDILTGKIKGLSEEPNVMQKLAHTFHVKKSRIVKHSDIFKPEKDSA